MHACLLLSTTNCSCLSGAGICAILILIPIGGVFTFYTVNARTTGRKDGMGLRVVSIGRVLIPFSCFLFVHWVSGNGEILPLSRVDDVSMCTSKYNGLFTDPSLTLHHHGGTRQAAAPSCVYAYQTPGAVECNKSSPLFVPYALDHCWSYHLDIDGSRMQQNGTRTQYQQQILASLADIDSQLTTQRIRLTYHATPNIRATYRFVSEFIDSFLIPRPWWEVAHEHHEHHHPHDEVNSTLNGSYDAASSRAHSYVILDRYHYKWENYLRFVAKKQYPASEAVCQASIMVVGRSSCIHPGWGSVTRQFNLLQNKVRFGIFLAYYPAVEDNNRNAFATSSDCPNEGNKWNCAFLPSTNCTVPAIIQRCSNSSCVGEEADDFTMGVVVNPASRTGTLVDTTDRHNPSHVIHTIGDHAADPLLQNLYQQSVNPPIARFSHIAPRDKSLLSKYYLPYSRVGMDSDELLFKFKVLLRPNAFYRELIDKLIHAVRFKLSGPAFTVGTPCVVVHIRRGDRTRVDINITEFCANITHDERIREEKKSPNLLKNCLNERYSQVLSACPSVMDGHEYACATLPFGAVTLKHVVARVHWLVESTVKDIVLFSEDQLFIESEVQKLKVTDPQWRVHVLPTMHLPHSSSVPNDGHSNGADSSSVPNDGHSNAAAMRAARLRTESAEYLRSGGGTESGVNLMTSFKLAQQCSAFIGHFGSAMTEMLFNAMCIKHLGSMGLCPPFFNLEEEYKKPQQP